MDKKLEYDALIQAIREFSVPFKMVGEADIKLDALVSVLLKTSFAKRRVGPERLEKLSSGKVSAPVVLREIGGEQFERVAQFAVALQRISPSSVLEFDDEMLLEANASREAFSKAFRELLPSIVGD
jgi:hypothetical protein